MPSTNISGQDYTIIHCHRSVKPHGPESAATIGVETGQYSLWLVFATNPSGSWLTLNLSRDQLRHMAREIESRLREVDALESYQFSATQPTETTA